MRFFLGYIFLVLTLVSLPSVAEWLDSCNNDRSRPSYDIRDVVCGVKAVHGYRVTESMASDSYQGYFSPEIVIDNSTPFYVFGKLSCSRLSATTLNYLDIGGNAVLNKTYNGRKVSAWTDKYVFPAKVCLRLEEVKTAPRTRSDMGGCFDGMSNEDKTSFTTSSGGKYGADFPGQVALCAYTSSYLVSGGDYCDDMKNTLLVKCLKIPQAPPPPPFCDMLMSAERVRAVYLKPDESLGINTYFTPGARLVRSTSRKVCDNGVTQDPSVPCPDGSRGTITNNTSAGNIAADMTGLSANQLPYKQRQTITLGSGPYYAAVTVTPTEVCIEGSTAPSGKREQLGCFPRTQPAPPTLDISGSLGLTPELDDLYVRPLFNRAPYDNPFIELKPVTVSAIASAMETDALAPPTYGEYFGMSLSAARIAFKPKGTEEDYITPKKICRNSDGKYAVREDATVSCDVSSDIKLVTKYRCSNDGSLQDAADQCTDGPGSPEQVKQCAPNIYVAQSDLCDVGKIIYEDDSEGRDICVQGIELEEDLFFIERSNGRKFFRKNPMLLLPITVVAGKVNMDYSRTPISYKALSQSVLDTMEMNGGGYLSINLGGGEQFYKFGIRVDKTSSGQESIYTDADTGLPFFVSETERHMVMPADPIRRGLCTKIPDDNLPPRRSFNIMYNHSALYMNQSLHLIPNADPRPTSWNAHFIDPVKGEMNGKFYPESDMWHLNGINMNESYRRNSPFPLSKDTYELTKDAPWANSNIDWLVHGKVQKISLTDALPHLNGFIVDDNLDTSGCTTVTFELWGPGARGTGSRSPAAANDWTFRCLTVRNNNASKGYAGESGAYVKGSFNLRRGSKLAVLVGPGDDNDNSYNGNDDDIFAGTALWLSEQNKGFQLIGWAKAGDPRVPRSSGPANSSNCTDPGGYAPYNNILDPAVFGFSSCGNSNASFADLYQRSKADSFQFNSTRATLLEFRNKQFSSFCGRSGGHNIWEEMPVTCPVIKVDSVGRETAVPVGSNLARSGNDSDVRRIGTWPFIAMMKKAGGNQCDWFTNIGNNNPNSKNCLKTAVSSTCNGGSGKSLESAPAEQCPGLGGNFKTNATSSKNETHGGHGMAIIKCT